MDEAQLSAVIAGAAHDVTLLEESLCDLVVALGGSAEAPSELGQSQSTSEADSGEGSCGISPSRVHHFRKAFAKLDLSAPALLRVLHLHLKRGAALLKHCPPFLRHDGFFHMVQSTEAKDGAPIITSLRDVKGVTRESLSDLVEGRHVHMSSSPVIGPLADTGYSVHDIKLFCIWYVDVVLVLYKGVLKRICSFGICDCIRLRCYFVNLHHILVDHGVEHLVLRREIYDLMLRLLRFALEDAWWLGAEREWLRSKLPFMTDFKPKPGENKLCVEDLRAAINRVGLISGQHGAIGVSRLRDVARVFGIEHDDCEAWDPLMGEVQQKSQQDEFVMFKRVVNERHDGWMDVLTVSLVTVVYSVLFEVFVRQMEMIKPTTDPAAIIVVAQTLSDLIELMHDTDAAYTAWAVDLLRHRADSGLLKAFKLHGEHLIRDADDVAEGTALGRLKWGEGILVYYGTLKRVCKMFYGLVASLVEDISQPAIKEINKYWGSKLWWELMCSEDRLLIGPKGLVSDLLRVSSKRVRYSICIELFSRVIAQFIERVQKGKFTPEHVIFNALAIWDSCCAINDFSSHYQNKNYHINKLFEILEKVKIGGQVEPEEPLMCARDFWYPLFYVGTDMERRPRYPSLGLSCYLLDELKGVISMDHLVWLGGAIRTRLVLFGSSLIIFTDDSTLQPIGIIDTEDVLTTVSPDQEARGPINLSMLDSDLEVYSCGTTETEMDQVESRRAANFNVVGSFDKIQENWGWRLGLRIAGCNLDTNCNHMVNYKSNCDVVEFEFLGPEHRERWSRSLKAITRPSVDSHAHMWWPKHSPLFH